MRESTPWPPIDLRSDTLTKPDARDARGDGRRRGRRRAVPRGSDGQRAAAPHGGDPRPRGIALPADRDDGEPGRAPHPDPPGRDAPRGGADARHGLRVGRPRDPLRPRHAQHRRAGRPRHARRRSTPRRISARAGSSCSRTRTAARAGASGRSTSSAPPSTRRHERGAKVHLDGARLFNASVGAGVAPAEWARHADSVTICFSKGLGCPLGAVVAGSAELHRARVGEQVPLRRRDAPGRRDRRGRALRARPPRRPARRGPRARAAARRGHRPGRERRRDELRRSSRIPATGIGAAAASTGVLVGDLRPGWHARGHAPRRHRRRHRARDRAHAARARGRPCPRLRRSPPSSSGSSRREQRDKRLPSIAAAVLRDGEIDLGDRGRRGRRRGAARGDARHAVPPRLDHEDVHRGRDHAAARRGQARPRGHARQARRGRRARADAAPAALAHVGPAARDARRRLAASALRRRARAARDARPRRSRCCRRARASTTRTSRSRCSASSSSASRGMPYARATSQQRLLHAARARAARRSSPIEPAATGYLVQPYVEGVWDEAPVETGAWIAAGQMWGTVARPLRAGRRSSPSPTRRCSRSATVEEMRTVQTIADHVRWTAGYGLGLQLFRDGERILAGPRRLDARLHRGRLRRAGRQGRRRAC